jgi:hypothetical protein
VAFSDVRGGTAGPGNINISPGFSSTTNFHLAFGSPCIDIGTTNGALNYDLDNVSRFNQPDIGCYEYNPYTVVNEIKTNESIGTVSPNPFEDKISLNFSNAESNNVKVEIFNCVGELVRKEVFDKSENIQMELSDLSSGIYICRVSLNDKVNNFKIIKK